MLKSLATRVLFGTGRFFIWAGAGRLGAVRREEDIVTTALVTEREQSLQEHTLRPLPQACRLCGASQARGADSDL